MTTFYGYCHAFTPIRSNETSTGRNREPKVCCCSENKDLQLWSSSLNALSGARGFSFTENFQHAVRLLPSNYSVQQYMGFLDDWGTVSQASSGLASHTLFYKEENLVNSICSTDISIEQVLV